MAGDPLLLRLRPALAACLALAGLSGCGGGPPRASNLILISLDTLRADRLGSYGYARDTTPHLDAFAAQSAVFSDVLTQFTSTHYSHQALFTGRYPFRRGIAPSLAQLLREAGFRTAGFTGGGFLHRSFGFDAGFELYRDAAQDADLETLVPLAIAWLRERRGERFFLFLHSYDVHCPYTPPEAWSGLFRGAETPRIALEGRCGADFGREQELTPGVREALSAAYDAGVRWSDDSLAPLLAELEALALLEDTIVVVTSDHGEALGEEGWVGHGRLSEAELAVPLILRMPGAPAGRSDEPAMLVDVLPTVLAGLGVEPTLRLDGVDLGPIAAGRAGFGGTRPRISQSTLGNVAIRSDRRFKLVTRGEGGGDELYDLGGDPTRDVIAEHARVASRLARQLRALIRLEPGGRPFRRGEPHPPRPLAPELSDQLRALGYAE
jgi:arylsulfatase A-like enzyme